jgi:uncharacterized coiled-coil DUF342 family protein
MNIGMISLLCSVLFYAIPLLSSSCQPYYMRSIELANAEWKQKIKLLTPSQILTIAELITTTYELLHENINLLRTKLALEEKLADIQTMSLTKEWHNLFNIQESDLKPLYQDLDTLQILQKKIQTIHQKLSKITPELLSVHQDITQTLLSHMKEVFFAWGIQQPVLSHHQELIEELLLTTSKFDALKMMINDHNQEIVKSDLKNYIQIIAQAHHQADIFIEKLASTRKEYFDTLNTLLFHFFKTFYTTTYQQATKRLYFQGTLPQEAQEIGLLAPPEMLFR